MSRSSTLNRRAFLTVALAAGTAVTFTADMALAADWIEAGRWSPTLMDHAALTQRWGFVRQPR